MAQVKDADLTEDVEVANLQDELVEAEESNQEAGMTPKETLRDILKSFIRKNADGDVNWAAEHADYDQVIVEIEKLYAR